MKVSVIPAAELTDDLRRTWTAIQHGQAALASPYFTPGFAEAAAACRRRVRVGVLEQEGRPVGFFPFEVGRFGIAGPVGGRMSDFQAVIAQPGVRWRPEDILAGCGLRMWRFDHLLRSQSEFAPHVRATAGSPAVDLRGGFAAYHRGRRSAGSGCIDRALSRRRRMQRDQGEVSFEYESCDSQVLEQVILWKREQCRRTGVGDFLAERENTDLLRRIHGVRTPDFAGVLSVLRVGDAVAAAHFGMRSRDTLHLWFPAYEQRLGRYSPGTVLLVELLQAAAAAGLSVLDLGKGDDAYKQSFCTHETPLAEGEVVRSPLLAAASRWRAACTRFLRTAPVAAPLRAHWRAFRRRVHGVWISP